MEKVDNMFLRADGTWMIVAYSQHIAHGRGEGYGCRLGYGFNGYQEYNNAEKAGKGWGFGYGVHGIGLGFGAGNAGGNGQQ